MHGNISPGSLDSVLKQRRVTFFTLINAEARHLNGYIQDDKRHEKVLFVCYCSKRRGVHL